MVRILQLSLPPTRWEQKTAIDGLCGSIDTPTIKEMSKDLLEGGQEAFEFRKQKYGF
jgi:hypothetical protein